MTQPRPLARRALIASALALAATPVFAAEKKSVEVGKVFPYLENYWKLPAGERSRFTVAYYLQRDGRAASGVKAVVIVGATRTLLSVGPTGRIAPLPTLAQIRAGAKIEFDVAPGTRFSMNFVIEPMARPAAELVAPDLALAVVQAAKGAKKVAGLLGLGMPTITRVIFKGVTSGQVIHADGRTAALPISDGLPYFEPAALKTARTLKFARAPSQMTMGSKD